MKLRQTEKSNDRSPTSAMFLSSSSLICLQNRMILKQITTQPILCDVTVNKVMIHLYMLYINVLEKTKIYLLNHDN